MRIPLEKSAPVSVGGLQFHKWIPEEDQAIRFAMDSFGVAFWPERPGGHTDEEISNWLNVQSEYLICELTTEVSAGIAGQLVASAEEHKLVNPELEAFARTVRGVALRALNRLLSYFRAAKGNFWLQQFDEKTGMLSSLFLHFSATVSIDGGAPILFRPSCTDSAQGVAPDLGRVIRTEDWTRAAQAVAEDEKPSLVGELLAAADEHFANGRRRVALTEAVSALDVAMARYANRIDAEGAPTEIAGVRVQKLSNHFIKFGLRGALQFLLPLLLPEHQLPRSTLETVIKAVDVRGTVVHKGQRDVDEEAIRKYLTAIRSLVDIMAPAASLLRPVSFREPPGGN